MIKKLPILFLLFFFCVFLKEALKAQTPAIDSLIILLKTAKEDTIQINYLNTISRELRLIGKYEQAMQYANDAITFCDQLLTFHTAQSFSNIQQKKATAYNNIGIVYHEQGDYPSALKYYFIVLKIGNDLGDKNKIAAVLSNIGLVYWTQGDYSKALEYYFKALKLGENLGDKNRRAAILGNIGLVYHKQADYTKALEYYFKALELGNDLGDKNRIATNLGNIGLVYREQAARQRTDGAEREQLYSKSLEYHLKALKMDEETGNKNGIARHLGNIGLFYYEQTQRQQSSGNMAAREQLYSKALEYYFKSLKMKEDIGDKRGIAIDLGNIGSLYISAKQYSKAETYIQKSLRMSMEIGYKDMVKDNYLHLSGLDSTLGNWKTAYEYHRLFSDVKDSIFNEESSKQIAEMQTKYETEKKELQIENLNKDNEIKGAEIKKQNVQKIAFASGFALMLMLAFIIFRGYKQKQKSNEIISAQKTEVENQKGIVEEKNKSLETAYEKIKEKNTEILDSIHYAKRIQEAILPPQKLVKTYLENSFILYKPKDIVAGDFYWMHALEEKVIGNPLSVIGKKDSETPITAHRSPITDYRLPITDYRSPITILFACCDSTGHGVPGAFVSILGYNALNRCVKEFGLTKPSEILDKLCEIFDEAFSKSELDIKDGMDLALCAYVGTQNFVSLQYAGAGNSLYHIRNGKLIEYSPDKQPIGKFPYRKPFTNHEIPLQQGDTIYIFTDGYADQFGGPKNKKFRYSRFEQLLVSIQEKSMTEQREILNKTIDEWRGEFQQIDDICVIGVRV